MENKTHAYFPLSEKDTRKFRNIIIDNLMLSASPNAENDVYDGIGRLAEKQMHSALKSFICSDKTKHEVKIADSPCYMPKYAEDTKTRKYVADILDGNTIYEIQTGGFSPLREKIKWILENTTCRVVLIHPIAETKWISKIEKSGEISGRRKSPRHGKIQDIAGELYYVRDFLNSPRFSLMVLMTEAEQYVHANKKSGRRLKKYELIPMSLLGAYLFKNVDDYRLFLPEDLPSPFTVKDFSKHTDIYGPDAYSIVKVLCHIGLCEQGENIGRAHGYIKK